ncbi:uncharacterized [Tachysurus ichikawai]
MKTRWASGSRTVDWAGTPGASQSSGACPGLGPPVALLQVLGFIKTERLHRLNDTRLNFQSMTHQRQPINCPAFLRGKERSTKSETLRDGSLDLYLEIWTVSMSLSLNQIWHRSSVTFMLESIDLVWDVNFDLGTQDKYKNLLMTRFHLPTHHNREIQETIVHVEQQKQAKQQGKKE